MRQELIDLFFTIAEHHQQDPIHLNTYLLYQIISQSLGFRPAAEPHRDVRYSAGRIIERVEWPRVYDLISRLWTEYVRANLEDDLREGINRVLAGYGSAWEFRQDGTLRRVLPLVGQQQVEAAFAELQDARYAAALVLLEAATQAYNDHPRRERDVCANAFDAVESLAKIKYGMPAATLGDVLRHLRATAGFNPQILGTLEAVNTLRNRNFGHGMVALPNLTAAEVDFTYVTCVGAVILLARTP
ncbi:MAG TPA: hypothetical protein VGD41_02830 [Pyrinomonadaceae bacterium]